MLLIACANVANLLLARAAVRQKEIALRLALGADRVRLTKQLLVESVMLSLIGGVVGLVIAFVLTRVMASLLFGISATDPLTFVSISFMLLLVALLASYIPALRATKVDPMIALRAQ